MSGWGSSIAGSQPRSRLRWLAVLMAAVAILGLGGDFLLRTTCTELATNPAGVVLSAPLFAILGLLIVFYRPQNRIGWLCLVIGVAVSTIIGSTDYAECRLADGTTLPGLALVAWYSYALVPALLVMPLFVLLPLVFPTGRFLTLRWRRATLVLMAVMLFAQVTVALAPDLRQDNGFGSSYPLDNPLGVLPSAWSAIGARVWNLAVIAGALLAIASVVARFRRSRGDERQQMKWFAYFLATAVAVQLIFFELLAYNLANNIPGFLDAFPLDLLESIYGVVLSVVFAGFPIAIGIAVFKYRLYDIDIIIRRTLQYTLVSVLLALVYFGSVTLMQQGITAVTGTQSPVAIVVSTLLIAALFNPLRRRVQSFVDRRFYRQRYDAEQVLAEFARAAREEVELDALTPELLRVVEETMQPEHVSLWLRPVASRESQPDGS